MQPGRVLLAVCSSIVFIGINTTAMNTVVGDIAGDFDMSASTVAWAISGYMLAAAAVVAPAGQFGDVFGRKRMLFIGLALFAISSVVIAASSGALMLILGRGLQGGASAMLLPSQLAIIRLVYPPERQGFAVGMWAATAAAMFAFGPLYGGAFADAIDWRAMFWFDLVLVGISALLAFRYIRPVPEQVSGKRPDWIGAVLLAVTIFAFVLAVQQGETWGWTSAGVLGAFAVSVVLGIAFWIVEHRERDPLVHFYLLRNKPYLAGVLTTAAQGWGLIGFLYFVAIYSESFVIYDETPLGGGVVLLPGGIAMFLCALVAGPVADRIGYRIPNTLAMALISIGAFVLMIVGPDTSVWVLAFLVPVTAAGVGIGFSTTSAAGMAAVDPEVSGEAAGIINVARYLGAVFVVALGTIVMLQVSTNALESSLTDRGISSTEIVDLDHALSQTSADLERALDEIPADQRAAVRADVADATSDGFRGAQLMIGIVMAGATVASFVLLRGERARAPKSNPAHHRGFIAHAIRRAPDAAEVPTPAGGT